MPRFVAFPVRALATVSLAAVGLGALARGTPVHALPPVRPLADAASRTAAFANPLLGHWRLAPGERARNCPVDTLDFAPGTATRHVVAIAGMDPYSMRGRVEYSVMGQDVGISQFGPEGRVVVQMVYHLDGPNRMHDGNNGCAYVRG